MYLFDHNTHWKLDYKRESETILSSYGTGLELHHIGSTAIDGLRSKDCIDILGVVSDISKVSANKQALVDIGYVSKGSYGIDGREYFSKEHRKVHLHVFEAGNLNIQQHLNFIKVMKDNLHLVNELNTLKSRLHKSFPNNKNAYQSGKKYFYDRIHRMAL